MTAAYWKAVREATFEGWHWPDATVPSVTDGDTFDALVSKSVNVGFGGTTSTSFRVRLRMSRINAPKSRTVAGKASSAWLTGLLSSVPWIDLVTLDAYKFGGPQYSPGEWMAEVTLPDGRNVSDLAVSLGFAAYWDGQGPRPLGMSGMIASRDDLRDQGG